MATSIIPEILKRSFVRDRISRVYAVGTPLSKWFGFSIGGPNNAPVPGNQHTYDIFDRRRTVANMRMPSVGPGTVAPNPVGKNTVTLARSNEMMPLDYNRIANIRKLGEGMESRDIGGMVYIDSQFTELKRRQENLREFFAAALCRGGQYGVVHNGDDLIPCTDTTDALYTVDFKIPSGNKLIGTTFAAGLQMESGSNILTASWATASTDIPLALFQISARFQAIYGAPLAHVFCRSTVWLNVVQNDKVKALAGTAHKPYATFQRLVDKGSDGNELGFMSATVDALPGIVFHVWDGGLELNTVATAAAGTTPAYATTIPDGYIVCCVENDYTWIKGIEGSEVVKDNDLAPAIERSGMYSFMLEKAIPTSLQLHTVHNCGIELNVPKALVVARVQNDS